MTNLAAICPKLHKSKACSDSARCPWAAKDVLRQAQPIFEPREDPGPTGNGSAP